MNKLILTVGLVGSMLTPNEIKQDGTLVHISEAIINIQDMTTWLQEDVNHGILNEDVAQYYYYWLKQTEKRLIKVDSMLRVTK
tara:strand:+ start:547 stop:795 length:249 start_codon:yes stop_codon:yes gene_type:complete